MTFKEYQALALTTDLSGSSDHPITSTHFFNKLLGLVGETGEIAEKFKKIYRDRGGEFTEADRLDMQKELGDVLWYVSTVAAYLKIPLDDIAEKNIAKLQSRKARGTQGGSGDDR